MFGILYIIELYFLSRFFTLKRDMSVSYDIQDNLESKAGMMLHLDSLS